MEILLHRYLSWQVRALVYAIQAPLVFIISPISGAILASTSSYLATYSLPGAMMAVSVVFLMPLPFLKKFVSQVISQSPVIRIVALNW